MRVNLKKKKFDLNRALQEVEERKEHLCDLDGDTDNMLDIGKHRVGKMISMLGYVCTEEELKKQHS